MRVLFVLVLVLFFPLCAEGAETTPELRQKMAEMTGMNEIVHEHGRFLVRYSKEEADEVWQQHPRQLYLIEMEEGILNNQPLLVIEEENGDVFLRPPRKAVPSKPHHPRK